MIANKKVRPPNGPGPNGLRGGRNTFSGKTAVGPWLDAVGGPSGYSRGFTTDDYQTEAQYQQLGAIQQKAPRFGAALPKSIVDQTPAAADTLSSKSGFQNDWSTTTTVMTTYQDKSFVSSIQITLVLCNFLWLYYFLGDYLFISFFSLILYLYLLSYFTSHRTESLTSLRAIWVLNKSKNTENIGPPTTQLLANCGINPKHAALATKAPP